MKKNKIFSIIAASAIAVTAGVYIAADHIDSPSVAMGTADLADLYAFEGANPANTVFIATLQGPLAPGSATTSAQFDENVMVEFNIDNTGDFVEDLVIQAIRRGDKMYFFGPVKPSVTGKTSTVATESMIGSANIGEMGTANGISFYAGANRDPFFFDFNQFNAVIAGESPTGFKAEGDDFFANLNVLSVVVEVPNSLLGEAPDHVGGAVGITGLPKAYNVWVSTKRK